MLVFQTIGLGKSALRVSVLRFSPKADFSLALSQIRKYSVTKLLWMGERGRLPVVKGKPRGPMFARGAVWSEDHSSICNNLTEGEDKDAVDVTPKQLLGDHDRSMPTPGCCEQSMTDIPQMLSQYPVADPG